MNVNSFLESVTDPLEKQTVFMKEKDAIKNAEVPNNSKK